MSITVGMISLLATCIILIIAVAGGLTGLRWIVIISVLVTLFGHLCYWLGTKGV